MSSNYNQVATFIVNVNTIYLVLVGKKATIICVLEYQLTGPPLSIKIKLV